MQNLNMYQYVAETLVNRLRYTANQSQLRNNFLNAVMQNNGIIQEGVGAILDIMACKGNDVNVMNQEIEVAIPPMVANWALACGALQPNTQQANEAFNLVRSYQHYYNQAKSGMGMNTGMGMGMSTGGLTGGAGMGNGIIGSTFNNNGQGQNNTSYARKLGNDTGGAVPVTTNYDNENKRAEVTQVNSVNTVKEVAEVKTSTLFEPSKYKYKEGQELPKALRRGGKQELFEGKFKEILTMDYNDHLVPGYALNDDINAYKAVTSNRDVTNTLMAPPPVQLTPEEPPEDDGISIIIDDLFVSSSVSDVRNALTFELAKVNLARQEKLYAVQHNAVVQLTGIKNVDGVVKRLGEQTSLRQFAEVGLTLGEISPEARRIVVMLDRLLAEESLRVLRLNFGFNKAMMDYDTLIGTTPKEGTLAQQVNEHFSKHLGDKVLTAWLQSQSDMIKRVVNKASDERTSDILFGDQCEFFHANSDINTTLLAVTRGSIEIVVDFTYDQLDIGLNKEIGMVLPEGPVSILYYLAKRYTTIPGLMFNYIPHVNVTTADGVVIALGRSALAPMSYTAMLV